MERIIDKEIAENIVKGNKIKAIKLLRERGLPFAVAHKIVMELSIIIKTERIKEVNEEIISRLNQEINEEKERLFSPVGTTI